MLLKTYFNWNNHTIIIKFSKILISKNTFLMVSDFNHKEYHNALMVQQVIILLELIYYLPELT
jgi:hypothetical protein